MEFLFSSCIDDDSNEDINEQLEALLPEVTYLVYILEKFYNLYHINVDSGNKSLAEEYAFVITQLFDIAFKLDYGDEVGRRKMFELLRNIMRSYAFEDTHLEQVVKLFKVISIDEKDFTRLRIHSYYVKY